MKTRFLERPLAMDLDYLRLAAIAETSVAGKTGTASTGQSTGDTHHGWFTGYAPAEDAKYCVTVFLQGAGSGGKYAAPLGGQVLKFALSNR